MPRLQQRAGHGHVGVDQTGRGIQHVVDTDQLAAQCRLGAAQRFQLCRLAQLQAKSLGRFDANGDDQTQCASA